MEEELETLLNQLQQLDKNIQQTEAQISKIHSNWPSARNLLGSDGEFIEEEISLLIVTLPTAKRLVCATSKRLERWKNVNRMHFEVEVSSDVNEIKQEPIANNGNDSDDDFFLDDPAENDTLDLNEHGLSKTAVPNSNKDKEENIVSRMIHTPNNFNTKENLNSGSGNNVTSNRHQSKSKPNKSSPNRIKRGRQPVIKKSSKTQQKSNALLQSFKTKEMRLILERLSLDTLQKYNVTQSTSLVKVTAEDKISETHGSSRPLRKPQWKIATLKPQSFTISKTLLKPHKDENNDYDQPPDDGDYQPETVHSDVESDTSDYCPASFKNTASRRRNESRANNIKAAKNFKNYKSQSKRNLPSTSDTFSRKKRNFLSGSSFKFTKHNRKPSSNYFCTKCGKTDMTLRELQEHKMIFHPLRRSRIECAKRSQLILKCDLCPEESFKGYIRLANHVINVHEQPAAPEAKIIKCYKCDRNFFTKFMFSRHIRFHSQKENPVCCEICEKRFPAEDILKLHLELAHNPDTDMLKCKGCPKSYRGGHRLIHLRNHEHTKHINDPKVFSFICKEPNCSETFSSDLCLRTHIEIHKEKGPYTCIHCSVHSKRNEFQTSIALAEHVRNHTWEILMKGKADCEHCERKGMLPRAFAHHMAKMHGAPKNIQCPTCPKTYHDEKALQVHLKTHERQKNTALGIIPPRTFPCDLCDKIYATKSRLNQHRKGIHERKFLQMCEVCGMVLMEKSSYKTHIKIHKGIREFVCYFCQRKFVRRDTLQIHIHTHTNEKANKCPLCPWAFSAHRRLVTHMKSHERGTINMIAKEKKPKRVKSAGSVSVNKNPEVISSVRDAGPRVQITNNNIAQTICTQNVAISNLNVPASSNYSYNYINYNLPVCETQFSNLVPDFSHIPSATYSVVQSQQNQHQSYSEKQKTFITSDTNAPSNDSTRTNEFDWIMH